MSEEKKMKVWECKHSDVVLIIPEGWEVEKLNLDVRRKGEIPLSVIQYQDSWHETTRFEITERKPDYQRLADERWFGKFWDDDKDDFVYGKLTEYDPHDKDLMCFRLSDDLWYQNFTPYTEPIEIDPLTMRPIP